MTLVKPNHMPRIGDACQIDNKGRMYSTYKGIVGKDALKKV